MSTASSDKDRQTQIQEQIARYSSACGCELGFVFMVGATIAFLVYINFAPGNWSTGGTVLRAIVWVVSMSVLGKLVALTYARVRLHMLRSAAKE